MPCNHHAGTCQRSGSAIGPLGCDVGLCKFRFASALHSPRMNPDRPSMGRARHAAPPHHTGRRQHIPEASETRAIAPSGPQLARTARFACSGCSGLDHGTGNLSNRAFTGDLNQNLEEVSDNSSANDHLLKPASRPQL